MLKRLIVGSAAALNLMLFVFLVVAFSREGTSSTKDLLRAAAVCLFVLLNIVVLTSHPLLHSRLARQSGGPPALVTVRPSHLLVLIGGVASLCAIGLGVWGGLIATEHSRRVSRQREEVKQLELGDSAPAVSSLAVDGKPVEIRSSEGKILLVHFWGSWDDTSVGSLIRLRRLLSEHADEVEMIGVCLDWEEGQLKKLIEELSITWPQVFESEAGLDNSVAKVFGVKREPSVWIIGSDGRIAAKHVRGNAIDANFKRVLRDERMLFSPAPEIASVTTDGIEWRLSDQRGKVVLLDFWATWCGPCRAELPHLIKVHATYGHRDDFVMLGVSLDKEAATLEAFCDKEDIRWPQLLQADAGFDNTVARNYEVEAVPSIWVIDKQGRVAAIDVRSEQMREAIEKAMR